MTPLCSILTLLFIGYSEFIGFLYKNYNLWRVLPSHQDGFHKIVIKVYFTVSPVTDYFSFICFSCSIGIRRVFRQFLLHILQSIKHKFWTRFILIPFFCCCFALKLHSRPNFLAAASCFPPNLIASRGYKTEQNLQPRHCFGELCAKNSFIKKLYFEKNGVTTIS